jgi:hypothetical protein
MTGAWHEVMARADDRCECRGECGRTHKNDDGRCQHLNAPNRPLNAVPRRPVPTRVAVTLPAAALLVLCGPCYDALMRARKAERAAAVLDESATGSLF